MSEEMNRQILDENEIEKQYQENYIAHIHRIGTVTMIILLIVSFLPAIYVSYVKGFHLGWSVIASAFAALVGINIFQWILEPVLYFPMLGITGTYIGFVAGNITPMRIPAAVAAQNATDSRPGTKKAEFAGVIGVVASVMVNFVVLGIVVVFGTYLIEILPQAVDDALQYALPGVYGALLISFIARLKM